MAGSFGLRLSAQGVSLYLITIIAITTIGPLQFGFHLAELNAPQDVYTCRKKSITTLLSLRRGGLPDCIPMDAVQFATVTSIFTVGGLFGALGAGPLTSRRGRLPAMRLATLFFLVGSVVSAVAASIPVAAIGRLLTGLAAGAATVIAPLYISEVSPAGARGLLGAATQVGINTGILATQVMGYFLSWGGAWRWIMVTGVILAIVHALALFAVPESPAWVACVSGDVAAARRTLLRIRGAGAATAVDAEVEALSGNGLGGTAAVSEEEGLLAGDGEAGLPPPTPLSPTASMGSKGPTAVGHLGFLQVLRDAHTRPAIIAVVGIMFAQQLVGINSVIMYSVSLLSDLLPTSSALLTILISVVNLFTTMACSPLPDRLGRKRCLLLSIIGQGSASLALAFSILFGIKILSAISVLLFVGFFAVGLGPVPFILASELVGQEAVGATQSWALGSSWVATFLVAQFFPIVNLALNEKLGGAGWVYFIFAAFAVLWAVFVAWCIPETKGKKDVDEVWGRTRRID